MTTTCKNCEHNFTGKYCNQCGQSANTPEINTHFLWHDIQHGFFHFDNGLFYTIKSLLKRPGYTIREFIEGKRVKHFKPISFVFFLATIFGILKNQIDIPSIGKLNLDSDEKIIVDLKNIIDWLVNHYAISSILLLVLASLSTYLAFKNQKYNYLKHLVLNSYLTGLIMVFNIAVVPLYFLLDKASWSNIAALPTFIGIGYTFWTMNQLFDGLSKGASIRRTLLSYVILSLIYLIIAIIVGLIISFWVYKAK